MLKARLFVGTLNIINPINNSKFFVTLFSYRQIVNNIIYVFEIR